jgi:hypothetical protein
MRADGLDFLFHPHTLQLSEVPPSQLLNLILVPKYVVWHKNVRVGGLVVLREWSYTRKQNQRGKLFWVEYHFLSISLRIQTSFVFEAVFILTVHSEMWIWRKLQQSDILVCSLLLTSGIILWFLTPSLKLCELQFFHYRWKNNSMTSKVLLQSGFPKLPKQSLKRNKYIYKCKHI